MGLSDQAARTLARYTACDVSDALLKLKVPGAGFLADLRLYAGHPPASAEDSTSTSTNTNTSTNTSNAVTVAPASTVLFAPKGQRQDEPPPPSWPAANIPPGRHYADLTVPGSIVVMRQPDGQRNAVCGGIMALRMKVRDARGVVVVGRARDLAELRETGLPIWARGLSTVGAGAASTPWAVQVPITVDDTVVRPGDVIVSDPANGVVAIPADKLDQVLELLPRLTAADDRVKEDVAAGMAVEDAFRLHRGG